MVKNILTILLIAFGAVFVSVLSAIVLLADGSFIIDLLHHVTGHDYSQVLAFMIASVPIIAIISILMKVT